MLHLSYSHSLVLEAITNHENLAEIGMNAGAIQKALRTLLMLGLITKEQNDAAQISLQ